MYQVFRWYIWERGNVSVSQVAVTSAIWHPSLPIYHAIRRNPAEMSPVTLATLFPVFPPIVLTCYLLCRGSTLAFLTNCNILTSILFFLYVQLASLLSHSAPFSAEGNLAGKCVRGDGFQSCWCPCSPLQTSLTTIQSQVTSQLWVNEDICSLTPFHIHMHLSLWWSLRLFGQLS